MGEVLLLGWYRLRAVLLALVFATCLTWSTSVFADQKNSLADYSVDQLIDLYIDLTFRLEGDGTGRDLQRLAKWSDDQPVKIYAIPRDSIFDNPDRNRSSKIIDLVALIGKKVSQPIGEGYLKAFNADEMSLFVSEGSLPPGFLDQSIGIYVGTRLEIRSDISKLAKILPMANSIHERHLRGAEQVGSPLCFGIAISAPTEPPILVRAWVFVEDTPEIETCIYEELMQTFGLFNDFPAGTASMFNDDNIFNRPTELDWLMWRVHFDGRLEPGMTEVQVREILPVIIEDVL